MVVEEERFGAPFPLVVAGANSDGIDVAPVLLILRVDLGVAVDFARRSLQDPRLDTLGQAQHVNGPHDAGFHGLDGVELVVDGRGGTCEVVDLVHLQEDRLDNVVPDELEARPAYQVLDVLELTGEEVVQAKDLATLLQKPFTEMGADEPGPAGDQDTLFQMHWRRPRQK